MLLTKLLTLAGQIDEVASATKLLTAAIEWLY